MAIEAWALFCLTEALLSLRPGPAALLIMSQALTRGRGAGVRATTGILAANALYFTLSASGLVAIHALSSQVFAAIQWAGAAYLIFLGARMIVRSFGAQEAGAASAVEAPRRSSYWHGFVTQGANPTLLLYFGAILPQFVDPAHSLAGQVAILALSSFAIEAAILSAYAAIAARAGRHAAPRFRLLAERLGGGLLVAAGAGLASLRRDWSVGGA